MKAEMAKKLRAELPSFVPQEISKYSNASGFKRKAPETADDMDAEDPIYPNRVCLLRGRASPNFLWALSSGKLVSGRLPHGFSEPPLRSSQDPDDLTSVETTETTIRLSMTTSRRCSPTRSPLTRARWLPRAELYLEDPRWARAAGGRHSPHPHVQRHGRGIHYYYQTLSDEVVTSGASPPSISHAVNPRSGDSRPTRTTMRVG